MAKNTKPAQPPEHSPQPKLPKEPRNAKPEPCDAAPSAEIDVSPAKAMQEESIAPPEPALISITLRTEQSFEYNLDLPREVVEKLLDPDVADGFIEVPGRAYGGQKLHGVRRFLHTSYIKEIDVRGL